MSFQPELSPDDRAALQQYEDQLQIVRDRVAGVAEGFTTGFYLWGEGGVSKSYTVKKTLRKRNANWVEFNSRMTPRALVEVLQKFPDAVHLLEDMEKITEDRDAQGVLRSALHGQRDTKQGNRQRRIVTWTVFQNRIEFEFRGGIIMVANCPMGQLPELRALETRIAVLRLAPGEAEIIAKMREIALQGFSYRGDEMEPPECCGVCEYLVRRSQEKKVPVNLRLLVDGGFMDFLQWRTGKTKSHWHDLVESRLEKQPVVIIPDKQCRAELIAAEREVAREISQMPVSREDRARLWTDRTGKSEKSYYRRLEEIKEVGE